MTNEITIQSLLEWAATPNLSEAARNIKARNKRVASALFEETLARLESGENTAEVLKDFWKVAGALVEMPEAFGQAALGRLAEMEGKLPSYSTRVFDMQSPARRLPRIWDISPETAFRVLASIADQGVKEKVIVLKSSKQIVDGLSRAAFSLLCGYKSLPTDFRAEWTDDDMYRAACESRPMSKEQSAGLYFRLERQKHQSSQKVSIARLGIGVPLGKQAHSLVNQLEASAPEVLAKVIDQWSMAMWTVGGAYRGAITLRKKAQNIALELIKLSVHSERADGYLPEAKGIHDYLKLTRFDANASITEARALLSSIAETEGRDELLKQFDALLMEFRKEHPDPEVQKRKEAEAQAQAEAEAEAQAQAEAEAQKKKEVVEKVAAEESGDDARATRDKFVAEISALPIREQAIIVMMLHSNEGLGQEIDRVFEEFEKVEEGEEAEQIDE